MRKHWDSIKIQLAVRDAIQGVNSLSERTEWKRANTVNDIYSIETERTNERGTGVGRNWMYNITFQRTYRIIQCISGKCGSSLFWMWSYLWHCVRSWKANPGRKWNVLRIWNMDEKRDKINDSIEHNVHASCVNVMFFFLVSFSPHLTITVACCYFRFSPLQIRQQNAINTEPKKNFSS